MIKNFKGIFIALWAIFLLCFSRSEKSRVEKMHYKMIVAIHFYTLILGDVVAKGCYQSYRVNLVDLIKTLEDAIKQRDSILGAASFPINRATKLKIAGKLAEINRLIERIEHSQQCLKDTMLHLQKYTNIDE